MTEKAIKKTLEDIGQKLIDLRKKKGYTSAETFSYDNDLPRVHYWRIEKGQANMTIKTLQKILAIHRINIEEFFAVDNKKAK